MNKYLCWYSYSGMETEGRVDTEPHEKLTANSKAEAIYKYICLINFRRHRDVSGSLKEWLTKTYCEGGWGYNVVQIDENEDVYLLKDFENYYSDLIKKQNKL